MPKLTSIEVRRFLRTSKKELATLEARFASEDYSGWLGKLQKKGLDERAAMLRARIAELETIEEFKPAPAKRNWKAAGREAAVAVRHKKEGQ